MFFFRNQSAGKLFITYFALFKAVKKGFDNPQRSHAEYPLSELI